MENLQNLKPTDTSKYNLRCNRNISEKMTKKDFVYDIPTPFQLMRKEKCLLSELKKPRSNFGCFITPSTIAENQLRPAEKSEAKLNKNTVGVLRLIQPQNLQITSGKSTSQQSGVARIVKKQEIPGIDAETEIRRQIVLPIQLRRKLGSDSKPPRYAVIPTNEGLELINESAELHADQVPERKILRFQCNYCQERLATRLSLSTHVKYHCGTYCTTCFWILKPGETMTQHFQRAHPVPIPAQNPSATSVHRR